MMKCWEEDPSDRPTFEKLRRTMKDMERNHKVKKSREDSGYLSSCFPLKYLSARTLDYT